MTFNCSYKATASGICVGSIVNRLSVKSLVKSLGNSSVSFRGGGHARVCEGRRLAVAPTGVETIVSK